jgi:ATP-binding cassette, subfamily C (CFTR/MRP), member 1
VGEQGIVISGGQKQRISLARAAYSSADIFLLDDPLSAVDSHVAKHLFERCIVGFLGGTTRVLVTHKLELLPRADHIVVMREGRAIFQGTYDALLSSGLDLTSLLPAAKNSAESEADMATPEAVAKDGAGGEKQPAAQVSAPTDSKLMAAEERVVGRVEGKTWRRYFAVAGIGLMVIPVRCIPTLSHD